MDENEAGDVVVAFAKELMAAEPGDRSTMLLAWLDGRPEWEQRFIAGRLITYLMRLVDAMVEISTEDIVAAAMRALEEGE